MTTADKPRYPSAVIDAEQRRVLDQPDLDDEQKAYILRELESWRDVLRPDPSQT